VADNVSLPLTGAGGTTATVATDEVSSAHYQYVKPAFGADGTATPVSSANPLPTETPAVTNQSVNTKVSVVASAGGSEVLAANSARKGLMLMHPDTLFYVAIGADPTDQRWPVYPLQLWSPPVNMTGQVKCLSSSGTINVSVFEC
jgi:hypothetical protein